MFERGEIYARRLLADVDSTRVRGCAGIQWPIYAERSPESKLKTAFKDCLALTEEWSQLGNVHYLYPHQPLRQWQYLDRAETSPHD